MSNSSRDRIAAAFDRELAESPLPPGLRALSIRAAVAVPRHRSNRPQVIALVATVLVIAVVATLVAGSHLMRQAPIPARSTVPPGARSSGTMAYDDASGQLVLFGGSAGQSNVVNETWTWDGKAWTMQHPRTSPPARVRAAMAYDPVHRDVLLFGGAGPASRSAKAGPIQYTDTWTWDGQSWTQHATSHAPAFSPDAAVAAFDPGIQTVLLFGYASAVNGELATRGPSQTWAWNGSDWVQLHPTTQPSAGPATLVSDGHRLLLLGQGGPVNGRYVTSTWAWNGGNWSLLSPKLDLPSGWTAAAYDSQLGRVVALDGGDTWTWDGATWAREHPKQSPTGLGYLVYDSTRKIVLSWGDQIQNDGDGDLWSWDGTNWQLRLAGPTRPKPQTPSDYIGVMSPAAAELAVRRTVTNAKPILLPSSIPAGMDAVVYATPNHFRIDYRSDDRAQIVELTLDVANPPPGTAVSSDVHMPFRSGEAEYFVFDPSVATSYRWLMWTEGDPKTDGTPYFLSAVGFTDPVFWQVANSVK